MGLARELLPQASAAALRPARHAGFHPPMLATLTDHPFSGPDWVFERKLDGVRAIIGREQGQAPNLWSRNEKSMDATYPELVDALDADGPERFVADGEIVAFDGSQTSFSRLQARIQLTDPAEIARAGVPVYLYLFDLLVLGEVDLTRLPLRDRKRLLRQAFDFTDPVRFSTHRNAEGEAFYEHACERGWEGLVAKRADSPYQGRRSGDWLKVKCVHGQEFVIGGFTDPQGSRSGFGALLLGYYDGDALRYAGKVGTGFDQATLTRLHEQLTERAVPASPFTGVVGERRAHWVAPELVAQIGFAEWTSDGRLRHPRYLGLREDKSAREVVREGP
jgi:DNA ligase D-like protein (predicted ligase)